MLKYLASPYTHRSKKHEDWRARKVTIAAGELIKRGHLIFCPIAHAHTMNRLCGLGGKFEFWQEFDERILSICDELWILPLPGWQESVGVAAETKIAQRMNLAIRFVHPVTYDICSSRLEEYL